MEPAPAGAGPASLIVIDPNGHRSRVEIDRVPFLIGRQPENQLILRDSRASRTHSRILAEDGRYYIEDCGSRHGTLVNGKPVKRHVLHNSDRIEFGVPDSYQLIFATDGAELKRILDQFSGHEKPGAVVPGGNLAKLRAILDLARTLQSSFSTEDVLTSVVDAALAITGCERGFLLLRDGQSLEIKAARSRHGKNLDGSELRVPRHVIHRALQHRRELLSMNFDPSESGRLDLSVADLELRSVVCVPLVRIRSGQNNVTTLLSNASETIGVLYMDSRVVNADMAGGNRELLQTLAIEASTILENARLLEEEREKRQIEEELELARSIQQSLLPKALPEDGWLRVCGSSLACQQVGGDYFDAFRVTERCWSAVVADVSGKGVGSALLASLLQGALLAATDIPRALAGRITRLNTFLNSRTGGEKYATVFYGLVEDSGIVHFVNAAQCAPLLVRCDGRYEFLETTGMPVGLMEGAEFGLAEAALAAGDKLILYTDGVTEAQNTSGEFFGKQRLRRTAVENARGSCREMHEAVQQAVASFSQGRPQADDITLMVLEYRAPTA